LNIDNRLIKRTGLVSALFLVTGCSQSWFADSDGDGFGNPAEEKKATSQPEGYVLDNTDCNDADKFIFPGNTETADGLDNNCDGRIDEGTCQTFDSVDLPKVIVDSTTSIIEIPASGAVEDIRVLLSGDHDWVGDLSFTLQGPTGTEVALTALSSGCRNRGFDYALDDAAEVALSTCPVADGGMYQPASALSAFHGEDANGTWTLLVEDSFPSDSNGSLNGWAIDICIAE